MSANCELCDLRGQACWALTMQLQRQELEVKQFRQLLKDHGINTLPASQTPCSSSSASVVGDLLPGENVPTQTGSKSLSSSVSTTEDVQHFSGETNPFLVFPKETWDMILNKVDDSADIASVFKQFPQLADLANGKQFSWLIGEVMPIIMSRFLETTDILNCRLVSKRYKSAIDSALETHPDRLPYKSPRLGKLTGTHFHYNNLAPNAKTDIMKVLNPTNGIFGYTGQNPFLGRHLNIPVELSVINPGQFIVDLKHVIPLLQRYGDHIWYVCFDLKSNRFRDEEEFILHGLKNVFDCLTLLPNLKSLELVGSCPGHGTHRLDKIIKLTKIICMAIPARLESLDLLNLTMSHQPLYHFVKAFPFHEQIKKLAVQANVWNPEIGKLFPNLSDLHIQCSYRTDDDEADIHNSVIERFIIRSTFHEMKLDFLRKLTIEGSVVDARDLFLGVSAKGTLECLELIAEDRLQYPPHSERGLRELVTASSVKELILSVAIKKDDFSCLKRLLKSLPAMQRLSVSCKETSQPAEKSRYKSSLFEKCFSNLYFGEELNHKSIAFLWKEFPNLLVFTLRRNEMSPRSDMRFARECKLQPFILQNYAHLNLTNG